MKINVIDSIPGSGKTSAAINYINSSPIDRKFMYVTPFLVEVERIVKATKETNRKFKEPAQLGEGKIVELKKLLNKGCNIVTTHVLFHMFDDEIIELCYSQGYTLIMDEVTEVIQSYHIGEQDLKILLNNFVDIQEDGTFLWKEEMKDYNEDKFIREKRLCELGCLTKFGDCTMIWMFPIKVFDAFKESYILTYLFKAQMQKYYYDYHKLEYNYLYIEGNSLDTYKFTDKLIAQTKYNYNELINILENDKMNSIGDLNYSLSMTWYDRHKDDILLKTLKINTLNYFKNIRKCGVNDLIWTTFKDYKDKLKGKGYTNGFVSSSARAVNEHRNKHNVVYLINKYFNPYIKGFFKSKDIEVYEDDYALSEMLQFIWRSAIRQGEAINIYIPSKRMRDLLQNWIDNNSTSQI